jgi:hypothetical protein
LHAADDLFSDIQGVAMLMKYRFGIFALIALLALGLSASFVACDDDDDDSGGDDDDDNDDATDDDDDDDDADWVVLFEDDFSNGTLKWDLSSNMDILNWPGQPTNSALGFQLLDESEGTHDVEYEPDGKAETEISFDLTGYQHAKLVFSYSVVKPDEDDAAVEYDIVVNYGDDMVFSVDEDGDAEQTHVEISLDDFCGWAADSVINVTFDNLHYGWLNDWEIDQWVIVVDDIKLLATGDNVADDDDDDDDDDDTTAEAPDIPHSAQGSPCMDCHGGVHDGAYGSDTPDSTCLQCHSY